MNRKIIYPGIYAIFNLVNGKVYIGQAVDLGKRYKEHWRHEGVNDSHNKGISDDFEIFGVDNFLFLILECIEFPEDFVKNIDNYKLYLKPYEDKWIDYYECLNPLYGYNKIYGGVTTLGASFYQEEWFKKIQSENHADFKGEKGTFYNHTHTEVTKRLLSELAKLRVGKLNPNYGKPRSQETRDKISVANLGVLHWNYGGSCTRRGKELLMKSPSNRYYFVINKTRFCREFKLSIRSILRVITGEYKHHKGWTGKYAEQWMVDKILPLMKEDQFWVEVDINGNIIT